MPTEFLFTKTGGKMKKPKKRKKNKLVNKDLGTPLDVLDVGDGAIWNGSQIRTLDREMQDYEDFCGRDG